MAQHRLRDAPDLLRRLPGAVNHLRHALPEPPVMIHICIGKLLIRLQAQLLRRKFGGKISILDIFQNRQNMISVHNNVLIPHKMNKCSG